MNQSKQKKSNGLLFFVVGLCFTAVVAVSLFTSASRSEKRVEIPADSSTAESTSEKSALKTQDESRSEGPESSNETKPSLAEGGKTSEKVSEKSSESKAQSEKRVELVSEDDPKPTVNESDETYKLPVNGNVDKGYEVDLPVFSLTMNDYRAHTGIDIACETGSGVCAAASGVVKEVYNDPMMGMSLTLEHADGIESHYSNLSETLPSDITVGAVVEKGQLIGAVGNTALVEIAQEPHLHFEMTLGGAYVDPLDYLESKAVSVSGNIAE